MTLFLRFLIIGLTFNGIIFILINVLCGVFKVQRIRLFQRYDALFVCLVFGLSIILMIFLFYVSGWLLELDVIA